MGCAFGADRPGSARRGTLKVRRNTIIVKPLVKVTQGEGVKVMEAQQTKVIFIFGGPGSGKGIIVSNLMEVFNIRFICAEELILKELAHRIQPSEEIEQDARTNALAEQLSEDSSKLTLDWVLSLVSKELQKYRGEVVLVDVIPNLKFLLRVPTLVKNCSREMKSFEEKHPVLFAINLNLAAEHVIANMKSHTVACTNVPGAKAAAEAGSVSDEVDTARTQRRFSSYVESVNEFLSYFSSSRRLTVVDSSCGQVDVVWESLRDYLCEAEVAQPCSAIQQLILFAFREDQYEDIDRDRYPILHLCLRDLVVEPSTAPPEELLRKIVAKMNASVSAWKAFDVDISGTLLASLAAVEKASTLQPARGELMFVEVEMGQLDYYMHGLRRKTARKESLSRKMAQVFKVVSTSEGDALLFPEETETELCRRIGLCFNMARRAR